jgi:hypothetical protein
MLMQVDLYIGEEMPESTIVKKKKAIFGEVVATISACFNCNHQ